MGLDPWLILLRYSHFEEIHFWLANFLQGRIKKFRIFIGWEKHFSENPLSMCRITRHSTFWAILCLSSHSCTIVSLLQFTVYSLQLKILWFFTFKILSFCLDLSCLFMVLLPDFMPFLCYFYLICSSTTWTPTLWTTSEQKECWKPRGVRGRVEDLSAAHPTD